MGNVLALNSLIYVFENIYMAFAFRIDLYMISNNPSKSWSEQSIN